MDSNSVEILTELLHTQHEYEDLCKSFPKHPNYNMFWIATRILTFEQYQIEIAKCEKRRKELLEALEILNNANIKLKNTT